MKSTAAGLALISSILLVTATPIHAIEQKTVFNTTGIEYKAGTGAERCQDKCDKRSGPDAQSLSAEGWTIMTSSPKKVTAEAYRYTPCSSCQPHGCICIGTEYLLQRDEPTPQAGTTPANEPVQLQKENDLLRQEMTLLRQENEKLKNQLKSIQKLTSE